MAVETITREQILLDLAEKWDIPKPVEDDEFTVDQAAEMWGMGWKSVQRMLKEKIVSGELTCRNARMDNGRTATVYRINDQ